MIVPMIASGKTGVVVDVVSVSVCGVITDAVVPAVVVGFAGELVDGAVDSEVVV